MGIIFLILKILGCILLFLLLVLLLVLFAPLTYKARGQWMDEKKVVGKISWLLFVLRVRVSYIADGLDVMVRVFGVPIYTTNEQRWSLLGGEKKPKKKRKSKAKKEKQDKKKEEVVAEKVEIKKDSQDVFDLEMTEQELEEENQVRTKNIDSSETSQKKKKSIFKRIVDGIKKCYNKIKSIYAKIIMVKHKVISVKELLEDEEIQDAIRRLWGHGAYILKITLPRSIEGWIHYGFDNPATTGQLLGVAGALIPVYGEKLTIVPDFEEEVFEAKGKLHGRLFLYRYIILAIKIYLDKDLWKQKERVMDTIGG